MATSAIFGGGSARQLNPAQDCCLQTAIWRLIPRNAWREARWAIGPRPLQGLLGDFATSTDHRVAIADAFAHLMSWSLSGRGALVGFGSPHELGKEGNDDFWLLLLYPMSRAIEQVASRHPGADGFLHVFDCPRLLVDAPVALAGNEDRRHLDLATRK